MREALDGLMMQSQGQEVEPPKIFRVDNDFPLERELCSVALQAPSQLDDDEGFGLVVGLWFGTHEIPIRDEHGKEIIISFGFTKARLIIETSGCDISIVGQFEEKIKTTELEKSKTQTLNAHVTAEAASELSVSALLYILATKLKMSIFLKKEKEEVVKETQSQSYSEYIVQSVSRNEWELCGWNNKERVLYGKILPDEALCRLINTRLPISIKSHISSDFSNVEVVFAKAMPKGLMEHKVSPNREAVCRALIRKGFGHNMDVDVDDFQGPIQLSTATLDIFEGDSDG